MKLLTPLFRFRKASDIPVSFFKEQGIKNIILDIDNTLALHNVGEVYEGISPWLQSLKDEGFGLIILSNNKEPRIAPFAEKIGLEYEGKGGKPLKRGYSNILKNKNWSACETASVGDQIFTDILGANRLKITSVFVDPIAPEKKLFFKFKRALEKPILKNKTYYDI